MRTLQQQTETPIRQRSSPAAVYADHYDGGDNDHCATAKLKALLSRFQPISLSEMESVSLLDRTDTKYVLGLSQLYAALDGVCAEYRVLSINQVRLSRYQTLYFDTPNLTIYQQHHNGAGFRYKVRARKYVDSDLSFFEVKCRTNHKRTHKYRLPITDISGQIEGVTHEFVDVHTPYEVCSLAPKLWNEYRRITLVNKRQQERVTLDLNLSFSTVDGRITYALPSIAIAEVKQDSFSHHSAFIQQMRRLHIQPISFSKYCIGVYLLYDGVKKNNFKAQARQMNKIMQEESTREFVH